MKEVLFCDVLNSATRSDTPLPSLLAKIKQNKTQISFIMIDYGRHYLKFSGRKIAYLSLTIFRAAT
jgi:hypothetical protein